MSEAFERVEYEMGKRNGQENEAKMFTVVISFVYFYLYSSLFLYSIFYDRILSDKYADFDYNTINSDAVFNERLPCV